MTTFHGRYLPLYLNPKSHRVGATSLSLYIDTDEDLISIPVVSKLNCPLTLTHVLFPRYDTSGHQKILNGSEEVTNRNMRTKEENEKHCTRTADKLSSPKRD